jgi:hypothetical protein
VRLDDSLLHVLLLLSKHHLQAVPVVAAESEDATVKGFITQVMSLLFSENLLIHRTIDVIDTIFLWLVKTGRSCAVAIAV